MLSCMTWGNIIYCVFQSSEGKLVLDAGMASWSLAQQLPAETLRRIYGPNFPLEVRHVLAQWIEKVPW